MMIMDILITMSDSAVDNVIDKPIVCVWHEIGNKKASIG